VKKKTGLNEGFSVHSELIKRFLQYPFGKFYEFFEDETSAILRELEK
jgi:hypothetical protein